MASKLLTENTRRRDLSFKPTRTTLAGTTVIDSYRQTSYDIGCTVTVTPEMSSVMTDSAEAFCKVVERLLSMTAPQNRASPITEDTEVYRDLGIYGDEIVDLVWWLEREFGVKTNINPFRYAPHESPFFQTSRAIRRLIGLERQYESLKVRDIVAAIEAMRWPDAASG